MSKLIILLCVPAKIDKVREQKLPLLMYGRVNDENTKLVEYIYYVVFLGVENVPEVF